MQRRQSICGIILFFFLLKSLKRRNALMRNPIALMFNLKRKMFFKVNFKSSLLFLFLVYLLVLKLASPDGYITIKINFTSLFLSRKLHFIH